MALRVLLADESTTIKKVMMLALQDFAVEVKAVHVGIDVLEVARSFNPDLIFADVLLQKRNGYEVTTDLKADPVLKSVPVVLMWSSFMDLDEAQAQRSGADKRLEKPFDVEALRKIVLDLVPNTRSQRLAHFLEYSDKVTEPMKNEVSKQAARPQAQPAPQVPMPPPVQPQVQPQQQQAAPPPPQRSQQPAAQPQAQPQQQSAQQPARANPAPSPQAPPVATQPSGPAIQLGPPQASSATIPTMQQQGSSGWSIESFDDMSQFEESAVASDRASDEPPQLSVEPPELTMEDEPEPFQRMDLVAQTNPKQSKRILDSEPAAPQLTQMDDDETWSHADLSRFKVELPPVSVAEEGLTIDMGEEEFTGRIGQSRPSTVAHDLNAPYPSTQTSASPAVEGSFAFEESLTAQSQYSSHDTYENLNPEQVTRGNMTLEIDHADQDPTDPIGLQIEDTTMKIDGGTKAQKMDPDVLEALIRAQSKEIIEEVVRRIVPDLASKIIREELERLLEDTQTATQKRRPRESRP